VRVRVRVRERVTGRRGKHSSPHLTASSLPLQENKKSKIKEWRREKIMRAVG
jgi:hypothetical protein